VEKCIEILGNDKLDNHRRSSILTQDEVNSIIIETSNWVEGNKKIEIK
jgi:hypothetical protein